MTNIIQWNCQGYRAKYVDLVRILNIKYPAVAILQETMLNNQTFRPPRGYSLHSDFNIPTPGNGLATLIRNDIPFLKLQLNTDLQATAFRVGLSRQYTICNLYIQPNRVTSLEDITNLIEQLPPPLIMGGDFNSRHQLWDSLCTKSDARASLIENALFNAPISILNTGTPTHFHVQTNTNSAIDLTIASADAAVDLKWRTLDDTYGSDHFPISIEFITNEQHNPEKRYLEHKANWNTFEENTIVDEDPTDLNDQSIEHLLETFTSKIRHAADIAIPTSSMQPKPKKVPWWTDECTEANRHRKIALRRYQRSSLVADKISYCRARAVAKNTQLNAKRNSWQKYVGSLNAFTPMSKIWKRVKKIRGSYGNQNPPYLIKDDIHISDSEQVAEVMACHYEAISSDQSQSEKFKAHRTKTETKLDFGTNLSFCYNSPITLLELKRMLASSGNSAPGEDRITYQMIRRSHPSCRNLLLILMNRIFDAGELPEGWLTSLVLSFLKPGKASTDKESYRPISLTSCPGKLLEKIINTRLTFFLENHEIIPPNQFGFRKMQSTMDSLNRLSTDILNSFENKQHTICVSFDMRKAYDTTWRYGILKKLHDIGLRGKMAIYIQNFLSNRKFSTKIGTSISKPHNLDQGVPQGSVLSCNLFSLAINDILTCIPDNINASLYVDDLIIWCSGSHVPGMERRIQCTINSISKWADSHGFTFSPTKTNCINFHRKRKFQPPLKLILNGTIIPNREHIQYLGMTFDYKLDWKEHIRRLKLDCTKRLDLLKCLSNTSWGSDRTTMLRLYRAIIRSKLDYGSFIYSSASETTLKSIQTVHNAAIRLSTGAYRSSPVDSLHAESAEAPLAKRREQLMLQYYARTLQLPDSAGFQYVTPACDFFDEREPKNTTQGRIQISESNLHIGISTMPFLFPDVPVWQLIPNMICNEYEYPRKHSCSDNIIKGIFLEHDRCYHSNQFHIFTDGSKSERGVGCAAVSLGGNRKMKLMDESSIFTAELYGILCALIIASRAHHQNFVIYCDSQSALHVVEHYESTHPIINKIIITLIKLQRSNKTINFCWCPSHVGIAGNEAADREAISAAEGTLPRANNMIPYRDWYPIIKRKIRESWNLEWQNIAGNKLRDIKDSIYPWKSSNQKTRKQSIILTRLRIGHTKLTHQYLMEKTHQPYCQSCIVPLSIRHILSECPSLTDQRIAIYPETMGMGASSIMKTILSDSGDFDSSKLVALLNAVDIYDKII